MINTQKIKAVIFDVDGVLINSVDSAGQFLWSKNLEKDLGIKVSTLNKLFNHKWNDLVIGYGDTKKHIEEYLALIRRSDISPDDFMSYWHKNDSNINKELIEICKKLKNKDMNLYLGTVQEKCRANYLWEVLEFKLFFKENFASCFIGKQKPDREYYERVEEKLSLTSNEILFLDDKKENIDIAIAVGWQGYHYTSFKKACIEVFMPLLEYLK